ncbi:MAG: iron-sulfur cluster repair protein YtfE [Alphaproteobacteria bacterium]|nr:iron-sulfur cluster repair protein YtfE [Alphaproteobacteria bacterium]
MTRPHQAGREIVVSFTSETRTRFKDRTLGDIAGSLPGATAVFRRSKLDFCCGGQVTLLEAATAKGLSLADLEAELEAIAATSGPAPQPHTTENLIDLIETRYHAVHRRELPELVRLAKRVEAVHKGNPAVPQGLSDLLARMLEELESHMQKEEEILFPMMRRGGSAMIDEPIAMMMAEHEEHGAHLRALEAITNNFEPPAEACTTWRALYSGARKLADDLVEHIHTENNILFPQFVA